MVKYNSDNSWPLIGNNHIIDFLQKGIRNNKVAHAYIFSGPSDLGKTTLARYFANILQGRSGDLDSISGDSYIIKREDEKKNISIAQIREVIKSLNMSSFGNSYKIAIIKEAETLSIEASNALLKTLEEPKEKVIVILITKNIDVILKTIVSRSIVLNFRPVKTDTIYDYLVNEHKASRLVAKNISRLSLGRPALATKFFQDKEYLDKYLERANIFLDCFKNEHTKSVDAYVTELLKDSKKNASRDASDIIDVWNGVLRDILLLNIGEDHLIQHHIINGLEMTKNIFSANNIMYKIKFLEERKEYLEANVNPKNVLEQILYNL